MSDTLPGDVHPESLSRLPLRRREDMDEQDRLKSQCVLNTD